MLGVGRALAGDSEGGLRLLEISALASFSALPEPKVQLTGAITLLDVVEFGGRQIVLAGTSTGGAGAWGLSDWDLVGRWQLFASPVKHFAFIDSAASTTSRTSNSIIFISANSPVALVSLFPPRVVFTLPGTKSAVEVVATNKDEILVLYEQGLARTCDIASKELRRSMDRKTAEGVLDNGSWKVWFRLRDAPSSCPAHPHLSLDLRSLIDESASQLPWSRARAVKPSAPDTPDASPDPSKPPSVDGATASIVDGRTIARSLTAVLATLGVDEAMDELLGQLGIDPPTVSLVAGLGSAHASSLGAYGQPNAPWTLSPVATAHRLLELVCLLRVFLNYPDTERVASEAIVYLASCLGDTVGPDFCPPSLDVLAQFWLDKNAEVQQAARSLFGTYLAAMPDDHILALVESWQDQLPARQQDGGVLHHRADHALLVIGLIATERFKLLSSSILVDVAESVALSLEDEEHPYHQAVAAELCSRGFGIWQNYVDAMRLVRQLFAIAIGRNPATPNDLRLLARNATLHVAGINTSLFMTTLLHDVLNASTASARNATLKLLGFIIRKKPLVLYSNLPRVVEAVVKSLDPNVSSLREAVQQTATVILHELVHSFPSVDFHGKSQRLAVGTNEGVAIVFDLRTATRLYVLEGHARPITALSWSPDGHRLVTVSLDESRVLAWRVSGGLLSMFMAGTPARQGSGSGATPFKTYDFHVGDEALMTTQATLEWVRFDWPAERTVRLRIRESALNFGV
ncbi:WD40 repeat domain-containing protein [Rhodotorula paludigena]|uniref:WD40 repeat domain-containing protein n=1 Tax=Rhodotorula paludigena TaxID=86838 RepID=UPI00317F3D98